MSKRILYDVCYEVLSITYVEKDTLWRMSRRTLYDVCQEGHSMTYVKKDTLWRMSRRTDYDVCQKGHSMMYVKKDILCYDICQPGLCMTYVKKDTLWLMSTRALYDICQQGHSMTYVKDVTLWKTLYDVFYRTYLFQGPSQVGSCHLWNAALYKLISVSWILKIPYEKSVQNLNSREFLKKSQKNLAPPRPFPTPQPPPIPAFATDLYLY